MGLRDKKGKWKKMLSYAWKFFLLGAVLIFTVSTEPAGTFLKPHQVAFRGGEAEVDLYTLPENHLRSVVCDGVKKVSIDALSKGSE